MSKGFTLAELPDDSLDAILALPLTKRSLYFEEMMVVYYPELDSEEDEYLDILELYISSFYLEKIYRSNRFLNEKYVVVYTKTGLIRNLTADIYHNTKDLQVH